MDEIGWRRVEVVLVAVVALGAFLFVWIGGLEAINNVYGPFPFLEPFVTGPGFRP